MKARDEVRTLCIEDYHKGYCGLLSKLATVGDVSENQFVERVKFLQGKEEDYAVFVIEGNDFLSSCDPENCQN